jgi:hypothetical protein
MWAVVATPESTTVSPFFWACGVFEDVAGSCADEQSGNANIEHNSIIDAQRDRITDVVSKT